MVFLSQKVDRNMIFTDYRKFLVLMFLEIGNTVFSYFELFGDGKYGLFFSAKKLMERSYLHGLFELSMIFQDLGNMVFRAVEWSLDTCRYCEECRREI